MKKNWKIGAGIIMVLLSALFYGIHYLLFHDAHHIFVYLVGDIAFVFIEVLLVSLIIHHLLNEWERKSRLKKLNMVIEVFFSEFGKQLLSYLSDYDRNLHTIKDDIIDTDGSCDLHFKKAFALMENYSADIDIKAVDIIRLSIFLREKRNILVTMLQNPSLLENEGFTEMLMAVFHVTEEFAARDLENLSTDELDHTKVDVERAYNRLVFEWLKYMEHIKEHYSYFFLFAMNTNPFDQRAPWFDRCYRSEGALLTDHNS